MCYAKTEEWSMEYGGRSPKNKDISQQLKEYVIC